MEAAYDVQETSHQHRLKRLMDVIGGKMGNTHGELRRASQCASNDQHLMRTLFTGAPFATMSTHIG